MVGGLAGQHALLLDHLIRLQQYRLRDGEAERYNSLVRGFSELGVCVANQPFDVGEPPLRGLGSGAGRAGEVPSQD